MLSQSRAVLFNSSQQPSVSFSVSSGHNIEDLVPEEKSNEACVYWYFGAYGLKQGAIDFYKESLSNCIQKGSTPFLVDLTAWQAFASRKFKRGLAGYHESANSLESDVLKTLKCSDFFDRLSQVQEGDAAYDLIQEINDREALLSPSASFDPVGFTLGDIFKKNCPAISGLYDLDCAKSYSIIQYLEFLFLVEMILEKKNVDTIRFILPNDEAKYYQSSIAQDLTRFLRSRNVSVGNLKAIVNCFEYGSELRHRPYNAPSKTIAAKKKLTLDKVCDPEVPVASHVTSMRG